MKYKIVFSENLKILLSGIGLLVITTLVIAILYRYIAMKPIVSNFINKYFFEIILLSIGFLFFFIIFNYLKKNIFFRKKISADELRNLFLNDKIIAFQNYKISKKHWVVSRNSFQVLNSDLKVVREIYFKEILEKYDFEIK